MVLYKRAVNQWGIQIGDCGGIILVVGAAISRPLSQNLLLPSISADLREANSLPYNKPERTDKPNFEGG